MIRMHRTVGARTALVVILAAHLNSPTQCQEHVVAKTGQGAPFEASWESLNARKTPAWFGDAKFGIFRIRRARG